MHEPVQVVAAGDPLWGAYLERAPRDFYYNDAYHALMQEQGAGEAWLAVAGSRQKFLAWPFLLRKLCAGGRARPDRLQDITSVYGYAGPLASGWARGDPFLFAAWKALVAYWRANGVVTIFCRFHPLLRNHLWVEGLSAADGGSDAPCLELRHEGRTVSLDLARSDEDAWAEYRDTHRRHINRARRSGLACEVDYGFEQLREFVTLYQNTMQRNAAPPEYFHDVSFFDALRRKLNPSIFLHTVRSGTRLAAAALVSEYQGIVQYLFGGVEDHFLDLSPLKLLLDGVRKWGRSRGDLVLHLGGGRGGREDSLFYFKSGFSVRRHPFYTGRCILDLERYRSLSEEHRRTGQAIGKTIDPNFFPAYRAPFTDASADQSQAVAAESILLRMPASVPPSVP